MQMLSNNSQMHVYVRLFHCMLDKKDKAMWVFDTSVYIKTQNKSTSMVLFLSLTATETLF